MTMTTTQAAMPVIQRIRAARGRGLPPPVRRREIRIEAGLSREDIARHLRAEGFRVTQAAIRWWELPKEEGGLDPRPDKALAYRDLLGRIQRELAALARNAEAQK